MVESVNQSCLTQHPRGTRLVSPTPVTVEGHSDQLDIGHRTHPSVISALSSRPVSSTPPSPSMITPRRYVEYGVAPSKISFLISSAMIVRPAGLIGPLVTVPVLGLALTQI